MDTLDNSASTLYNHLLMVALSDLSTLRQKWLQDIRDMDDEDWTDMWDAPFKQLVSLRDHLIQFKIFHRAYYTSHRLHRFSSTVPPSCWRCDRDVGDFFHIFWTCLVIHVYWAVVVSFIRNSGLTHSLT